MSEKRPTFTKRVKRGLVLLAEGNGWVNPTERDDIAAARAWIAWGVAHRGWLTKRKRPAIAAKLGYS